MSLYSQEEYNNEPVHYCVNCLSLNIKEINKSTLHACLECGNIKIEETSIDNWNELYNKQYGRYFLSEERKILEE